VQVYNPVVATAYPERSPAGGVPEPGHGTLLPHQVRDDTVHLLALDSIPFCSGSAAILPWPIIPAVDAFVVRRKLSR
jgi:hypothetical protein